MTAIEVLLSVPDWVQSGLSLGQFERVGGVVREVSTGRVVAWLREGSQLLPDAPDAASAVLRMAGSLAGAGFVLNLALSAASLSAILIRLNQLQTSLDGIRADLDGERDTEFKNALEDARDAVEMANLEARQQRANSAISDLRRASLRLHQAYSDAHDAGRLAEATEWLVREMYAVSAMTRCYLELGEADIARLRLAERAVSLLHSTRRLVTALLGEHPAAYLHRTMTDEVVRRFAEVMEWMHGRSFAEIVLTDLRADFWNHEALEAENAFIGELARRFRRTAPSSTSARAQNLVMVETLIENARRLEGFELELRSMRLMGLSFAEWQSLADSQLDFAVLVPAEPLAMRG